MLREASKTINKRTSVRPVDPGRNSFKFRSREPVNVSTKGRPVLGPSPSPTTSRALAICPKLPGLGGAAQATTA